MIRKKRHLFQSEKNKASSCVIRGCRWYPPPKQPPHLPGTREAQLCHLAGAGRHFPTLIGVILQHATTNKQKNPINMAHPRLHHSSCCSGADISRHKEARSHLLVRDDRNISLCSFSQKLTNSSLCLPISIKSGFSPAVLRNFCYPMKSWRRQRKFHCPLLVIRLLLTAAKSDSSRRGLSKHAN